MFSWYIFRGYIENPYGQIVGTQPHQCHHSLNWSLDFFTGSYLHPTITKTSRRKRYRRTKMIKITTSSQRGASFCIQNLSKKKVHLLWEWQPFHDFSLKKGNRNFFSHFLQRVSGGFHQVFPCALPLPLEKTKHRESFMFLFHMANVSQPNTRHPKPIHLTRREPHSEGSENMKEKNVNVFMSACICQRDVCMTSTLVRNTKTIGTIEPKRGTASV